MTPRKNNQRLTAKHTRPQALGWRYAPGRSRILMIKGSEGAPSPLGAYLEMPSAAWAALAIPVTRISMLARPAKPGKNWYQE